MLNRDETGAIVNTASISSEYAQLGHTMYDASKGAVMMITRVAALELAQHDIRVNAVAPGLIDTTFGSGTPEIEGEREESLFVDDADLPDLLDRDLSKDAPMGRGTPTDVAGAFLFLGSTDAAYVTGHLLYVDGGYQIL
jgi:NAD(P)-dependent dehydrogenase (short-subunit alcohol dehydrogenase family)